MPKKFLSTLSRSSRQTRILGERLGRLLMAGDIVGLTGELGSGKTCFARGMVKGLEVAKETWIRSPSFTLINEYSGRLPIYHIDLYRINSVREMEELNLREYLFSEGVSLIEWFNHLASEEVTEYMQVDFVAMNDNRRKVTMKPYGEHYEEIIKGLKDQG